MSKPTITSYTIGFLASIVLTLAAYVAVVGHLFAGWVLLAAIFVLAFIQLMIQLVYFLHMGADVGSRWKVATFISTIGLVFIIMAGSIWIMNHLNYAMMASPDAMNQYIDSQQAF